MKTLSVMTLNLRFGLAEDGRNGWEYRKEAVARLFREHGTDFIATQEANDFQIDYEMFSDHLSEETFPKGADWLMLGPTGPRRLRLAVEYLCQIRGGICFLVDLDPRWVNKLIKRG